jgi:hemin uptake protein HemP
MNNPAKFDYATSPNLAPVRAPDESAKRSVANKYTTSEMLFAGARELVIAHAGDEYRLRMTGQGKLILTK